MTVRQRCTESDPEPKFSRRRHGLQEWVAPDWLLAPWGEVEVFRGNDAAEMALAKTSCEVRGTVAFEAAHLVLGSVRPKKGLRLRRGVADAGVLEIARLEDTAVLLGLAPSELRDDRMLHQTQGTSGTPRNRGQLTPNFPGSHPHLRYEGKVSR